MMSKIPKNDINANTTGIAISPCFLTKTRVFPTTSGSPSEVILHKMSYRWRDQLNSEMMVK